MCFFVDVRFCFFGTLHLRANYMEEDFKNMMRFGFVCFFFSVRPVASFETKSVHIALPFLECSRLDSVGVPVSTTASQRNLTATTGAPNTSAGFGNKKCENHHRTLWVLDLFFFTGGSKLDLQTTSFEIP